MSIALPTYGADRSGMVCGFVFSPDTAGRPIAAQEALEWLARGTKSTGSEFLWLHFNLAHASTDRWMRDHLALTEAFQETLGDGSQSTRIAAQVNQQNNRSLFLLTVFTVLALPINIIAGLFGMNVGGIPMNQDDRGFWTIVGIVAAFTVPTLWIVLRRRRD